MSKNNCIGDMRNIDRVVYLTTNLVNNYSCLAFEDLNIKLDDGKIIVRKFWEVRAIKGTSYEKKE